MWRQFLNESRSERKFENTPVIVLGSRHSGKRSLVDSLFDISKTTLHQKRIEGHTDTNKMRLKGLTPIIDYAYLNVLDIADPDYRTHSKLQVYMVEERGNPEIYEQLRQKEVLKRAVVVMMLDFTTPWNFMEELDGWINFLYELQKNAGFTIGELEQMAEKTSKYYQKYREPEYDENGKIKTVFELEEGMAEERDIPEGVLSNNIRFPLLICVNKCDLQSSVLRDESANKILFIMYHLRKYCLKYGGTLIYTSIKNNSNLSVLYEYILHRSYGSALRHKPEMINEEAIFIPLGADSPSQIEDSVVKMDMSRSYSEVIAPPASKKTTKEEVVVEEDSQFFKKYINMATSTTTVSSASGSNSWRNDSDASSGPAPGPNDRAKEVAEFFGKFLKNNNLDEQKKSAQNELLRHTALQANKTNERKRQ